MKLEKRRTKKVNKRVYGVIGIKSIMSNWNADFSGYPKTISNGETFGSDKALKYPMKRMWEDSGEKVLYIKSLRTEGNKNKEIKVVPKSLKERYEELFSVEDLKKEKDGTVILRNLFSAIDVKNFGATFAEEGNNISITGAVQIGQGFNKYDDTVAEVQQILSPFRVDKKPKSEDKDKEEAGASTLGSKIVSDEAHYFYPFVINPNAYNNFVKMGVTEGYTEEDYKKFKEASLISATAFNTNAKIGCENEFAIFIETELETYLPNIDQYISFEKTEDKDIIKLEFIDLIESMGDYILNIEIYYNPYKTKIEGELKNAKYFNIFTKEVL
jgi:CRISPR-associated protein Csh2